MSRKLPNIGDVRTIQKAGQDVMKFIMKKPIRSDIGRVVKQFQQVARVPVKPPRR